jgi:hypothetical protein
MKAGAVGDFARGLLVGIVGHLGQLPVIAIVTILFMLAAGPAGGMMALFLAQVSGTTQIIYMVPLIVRGMRRGEASYVGGLCCAGILLCLANVSWFVVQELRRPIP